MATLIPTLTLTSTDATTDQLSFTVTDSLSVTAPHIGLAKLAVSTTGANNIIQPATDGQTYYVYVKHTGVDSSGSTVTRTLKYNPAAHFGIVISVPSVLKSAHIIAPESTSSNSVSAETFITLKN